MKMPKTLPATLARAAARGNQDIFVKLTKSLLRWMMLAWLLCAARAMHAQATTFSFTLDEPCKTSAGVFATDGTLVRTLWSKTRYYAPGTYSAVWDGLDDHSNAVPAGVYQVKLLQHNTEYAWDGVIGNTSEAISGIPRVSLLQTP